tara:strand:+ start:208 stop:399 length:192 start_codon:yes stop_codon:yes gene_type:complete
MAIVKVEITESSSELNLEIFEETPTVVVEVVENQILDWASTYIDGGSPETTYLISQIIDGGIV